MSEILEKIKFFGKTIFHQNVSMDSSNAVFTTRQKTSRETAEIFLSITKNVKIIQIFPETIFPQNVPMDS